MKAKCRQNPANKLWYCNRMGVTGEGKTPMEALKDMWSLYRDLIHENQVKMRDIRNPRA